MTTAKRTYWLDGLKFISMIVVVLCHFRMAFFYDKFRSIDFNGVLFPNYFFNGNLAVCMFLLISCYLFALKAQKAENESNMDYRLVKKRFFRLWIPAVVVNLLIFVLYASHLFFNKGAYDESVPYVNDWFSFSSTVKAFGAMLWADANTCLFSNGTNPPLWCYYLLFFLPLIAYWGMKTIKGNDILIVSLLILPVLFWNNSYFAVVLLAIIVHNLSECRGKKRILICVGYVIGIILCIMLHCIKLTKNIELFNKFTESINMFLAASILGLFVMFSSRNILNFKLFEILNKISFSIYLLHMPVICSIGFFLYKCGCDIPLIFFVVTLVLVLLSIPFHIFVEKKLTQKIMELLNVK